MWIIKKNEPLNVSFRSTLPVASKCQVHMRRKFSSRRKASTLNQHDKVFKFWKPKRQIKWTCFKDSELKKIPKIFSSFGIISGNRVIQTQSNPPSSDAYKNHISVKHNPNANIKYMCPKKYRYLLVVAANSIITQSNTSIA